MRSIYQGKAEDVLPQFPDACFDALICDPPSSIHFMGREWDSNRGGRTQWVAWLSGILKEAVRTLKPGAHGLIWALPKTSHWTMTALEDAGFEIRDVVTHIRSEGMPKSRHSLKPAVESWVLVRKPLTETSLARQIATTHTGGINIDACRIAGTSWGDRPPRGPNRVFGASNSSTSTYHGQGRYPANLILSHSPLCTDTVCDPTCAVITLDNQGGIRTSGSNAFKRKTGAGYRRHTYGTESRPVGSECITYGDTGTASRFFTRLPCDEEVLFHYESKASPADRTMNGMVENGHETVKSTALMAWLCTLITPPGGTILDCFMGSGSTLVAASRLGFSWVGIDESPEYCAIARARLATLGVEVTTQEVTPLVALPDPLPQGENMKPAAQPASDRFLVRRVWAMPSVWTFSIQPIKDLIGTYLTEGWIDPFAGEQSPADVTNDIEGRSATFHLDALEFLRSLPDNSANGALFDPPYSVEQCLRRYTPKHNGTAGRAEYWAKCKDEITRIVKPGGCVISCCWDSTGMGKKRGFAIEEILLVCHGACHNDTVVTVERKAGTLPHESGASALRTEDPPRIRYHAGSIFNEVDAQVLVNPVNCQGIMGKGLARQFKERYPEMVASYREDCRTRKLAIGHPRLYKGSTPWILNLPTKDAWTASSRLSYIEESLQYIAAHYQEAGITSLAFPKLGCGEGGLSWDEVGPLMVKYLSATSLDVTICVSENDTQYQ